MTAVVIGAYPSLNVVVGEHGVVEGDSALRGVALALLFDVVHAVDVYDALVVVSRMPLDLDHSGVRVSGSI